MSFFTLPLYIDEGQYNYDMELSGEVFTFFFYFNNRSEKWVISMYDSNGDPIFQGLNLVLGYDYFNSFSDSRLPNGNLVLISMVDNYEEPTRENLDQNFRLTYYEA